MNFAVIFPNDPSTEFLHPVLDVVNQVSGVDYELIRTAPTESGYQYTRKFIAELDNRIPIVFMGHGHSRHLYGGVSDSFERKNLLGVSDTELLEGRTLILLACRSSEFVWSARDSIKFGLGFGDLPTDWDDITAEREFYGNVYDGIDEQIICDYRNGLVQVFAHSIKDCLESEGSLQRFALALKLRINKKICDSVLSGTPPKRLLADMFYSMKHELQIVGDDLSKFAFNSDLKPETSN